MPVSTAAKVREVESHDHGGLRGAVRGPGLSSPAQPAGEQRRDEQRAADRSSTDDGTGLALITAGISAAAKPGMPDGAGQSGSSPSADDSDCQPVTRGSPYIPVDSWVYPAVLRLYALGYVDTVYLGMRPWTRVSLSRMLDETEERLEDVDEGPTTSEAEGLYDALKRELRDDSWDSCEWTRAPSASSLSTAWRAP